MHEKNTHDIVAGDLLHLHWRPHRRHERKGVQPRDWWAIAIAKDGLDWFVQVGETEHVLRWQGSLYKEHTTHRWSLYVEDERMIYQLAWVKGGSDE